MSVTPNLCTSVARVTEEGRCLDVVRSGSVFAVGHDSSQDTVLVRFCNHRSPGRLYEYLGTSRSLYEQLLAAPSAYAFIHNGPLSAFPCEVRADNLRHPLEETWDYCVELRPAHRRSAYLPGPGPRSRELPAVRRGNMAGRQGGPVCCVQGVRGRPFGRNATRWQVFIVFTGFPGIGQSPGRGRSPSAGLGPASRLELAGCMIRRRVCRKPVAP